MKKVLSVALAAAMLVTLLLSAAAMQVSAAADATVTLLASSSPRLGETVEVVAYITEGSCMVNADMDITYDPTVLEPVDNAYSETGAAYLENVDLLAGYNLIVGTPMPGVMRLVLATSRAIGLQKGGELIRVMFRVIGNNVEETVVNFTAKPFRGNDGSGEPDERGRTPDFDINGLFIPAVVKITDAEPSTPSITPQDGKCWLLYEQNIISGAENVTVNEDGLWKVTGSVTLSVNLEYNYTENYLPNISQSFDSTVPYSITLIDGVNDHAINLHANWVGGDYFDAGPFEQVDSIKGVYDWNTNPENGDWADTQGKASITEIRIELDGEGELTIYSLALTKEEVIVEPPVIDPPSVAQPDPDVNGDGSIDIVDAVMAYQAAAGDYILTDEQLARANINGGQFGIEDALDIFLIVAGRTAWF